MGREQRLLWHDILISIIFIVITSFFFGFVPDDYDYFMGSLAVKQFSDFRYFDFYFQGYIFIRDIYNILYESWPEINWHFLSSLLFETLALFYILRAISCLIFGSVRDEHIFLLKMVFCFLFLENIFVISHTRVSLLFCGVSLTFLGIQSNMSWRKVLLHSVIFLLGMLLRPESALGSLTILFVLNMICYRNIKQIIRNYCIPTVLIIAFTGIFYMDLSTTEVFVKKIEPEVEYKIMSEWVVDLSQMKSASDSIKYELALNGSWFDTKEFSPEYLRSLIKPGFDISLKHIFNVFNHVNSLYMEYPYLMALILLLLTAPIFYLSNSYYYSFMYLIIVLFTYSVLFIIDFPCVFLLSNRHFISINIFSLLFSFIHLFNSINYKIDVFKTPYLIFSIFIIIISLNYSIFQFYINNKNKINELHIAELNMTAIDSKYNNRLILSTLESRLLFDRNYSLCSKLYDNNKYIMFDWFTFSLVPRYVDYVDRVCKCDSQNPVEFFKWMQKDKVLIISSISKFEILKKYIKIVYKKNLDFIEPVDVNSIGGRELFSTKDCQIRNVVVAD